MHINNEPRRIISNNRPLQLKLNNNNSNNNSIIHIDHSRMRDK